MTEQDIIETDRQNKHQRFQRDTTAFLHERELFERLTDPRRASQIYTLKEDEPFLTAINYGFMEHENFMRTHLILENTCYSIDLITRTFQEMPDLELSSIPELPMYHHYNGLTGVLERMNEEQFRNKVSSPYERIEDFIRVWLPQIAMAHNTTEKLVLDKYTPLIAGELRFMNPAKGYRMWKLAY